MHLPSRRRLRPTLRGLLHALATGAALVVASGCGSTIHLTKEARAQRSFEEARELGAERYAPFEFYSAQTRLTEAKRQAAHAEYGTAARLSDEANRYSRDAILIAKQTRGVGGSTRMGATPE